MLFFPDLFHNLEEGEIKKARERFKTLLFNSCRARTGTKAVQGQPMIMHSTQ